MNYKQIYKKIIDWYDTVDPRLRVGEYDNKVGFTDGFLVYLLPKDKNPFDIGKFREIDLETALKLLTHFKNCNYKQADEYSPVFIYKYGELQGIAFPVKIKD